uniref:Uncharacterized protein n=1 Tax=Rhizophora mucronata TaxID=61149 RepID=A0A2P2QH70_RHIMU
MHESLSKINVENMHESCGGFQGSTNVKLLLNSYAMLLC